MANRVCTTDCSSTSGSRTTWSASSVTGVPGVATMTMLVTGRSARSRRISITSVVVPDRVIARTAS